MFQLRSPHAARYHIIQVRIQVMPRTIERAKEITLPLISVRGTVAFPKVQLSLELAREATLRSFAIANQGDGKVFLLTQKDVNIEEPAEKDHYHVGTVCQIKRVNRTEGGSLQVIFEGICRAKVSSFHQDEACTYANVICKSIHVEEDSTEDELDKMTAILQLVESFKNIHPILNDELLKAAAAIKVPGMFCDFIASSALLNFKNKQRILEIFNPIARLDRLVYIVEEEMQFLRMEYDIHCQVKQHIDDHQKEYFLREQIKAIQQELGDDDDEIAEYQSKIDAAELPDAVREKLNKELSRLAKTPFGAAEGSVLRTYLDTCLEFPWKKATKQIPDVKTAKRILEEDHDGLEKVKKRILEYVAVKQLCPDVKNQIICLVGPPGVGKTSIAASIARAMKRKYARISLGGIRDEADIRGHRKTYVGAMPGRVVEALISAKVNNPVIVLDEIDKLSSSLHGDPSSALLEVLDPEQNRYFRDHFLELPVDLSDCVFIATANGYDGIPLPLIDRMEIIELSSYTKSEKLNIALHHLIPKQLKRHGMNRKTVKFKEEALHELIEYYTKEAGVRNLEREIAALCRKAAVLIAEKEANSVTITAKTVNDMLGKRKYLKEDPERYDTVGIVNGLAYTQSGGDLLKVEVAVMEGTGKLELTGQLGDVMQESAKIALSYIRSVANELGIPPLFYKERDIHIHFPEGAIPKDGPSAGVAMTCALASALLNIPTRRDVAMTGEVTLHGRALPIGGLKEKTMAAYASGIKTVLIPRENERDLDEIDPQAREHLNFVICDTVYDALKEVLTVLPTALTASEDVAQSNQLFPQGERTHYAQSSTSL